MPDPRPCYRGAMARTRPPASRGAARLAGSALAALVLPVLLCAGAGAAPPSAPAAPGAKQCCQPSVLLLQNESRCADGSPTVLSCKYKFLVDGNEGYELSPNGSLVLGNSLVRAGFCLAQQQQGGETGDDTEHRDHGTREVVLVCFDSNAEDGADEPQRPQLWFDVATALSWLSVACLALTLAAHLLLPELRDLQGRCHMGAVASLGLGLFVLAVLQSDLDGVPCTVMAFLAYYWLMSAFFWLNVTAFNVWRSVVLEHVRFRERTLFVWYCSLSQGLPLAFLLLLLAADQIPEGDDGIVRPHFGTNKCWFQDDRSTWAWFYWPLAVLLGLNVVYFVWTTARLWRQYGAGNDRPGRRKLLQRRFLLSLKLFLIMGIGWIFELISSAANIPAVYWYLTDAFNAMQGVVILAVLVLTRRRVWRALHRLRPCGLRPPDHWAFTPGDARPDDDGETTDSEEDVGDQELNDMSATRAGAAMNGHHAVKANGTGGH